jgi:hypothetical protein
MTDSIRFHCLQLQFVLIYAFRLAWAPRGLCRTLMPSQWCLTELCESVRARSGHVSLAGFFQEARARHGMTAGNLLSIYTGLKAGSAGQLTARDVCRALSQARLSTAEVETLTQPQRRALLLEEAKWRLAHFSAIIITADYAAGMRVAANVLGWALDSKVMQTSF